MTAYSPGSFVILFNNIKTVFFSNEYNLKQLRI